MRRLVSVLVRCFALGALAYAIYRLIADGGADERADGPGAPTGGGEATPAPPEPPATRTRAGAGTAPGGTRRPPTAPPVARAAAPPGPSRPATTGTAEQPESADVGRAWVEADAEGACPVSHPIKGKVDSGIFHPPEGRHYERTKADRCYRDAVAAEADGLRRSKQ